VRILRSLREIRVNYRLEVILKWDSH
jgi:hypothetical protein